MVTEREARELLVEYGKKLLSSGLVQGTWGNISIRIDENHMMVTPTGLDYERLTADDMVKVDINTLEYEGILVPTSEKGIHAAIYKNRDDVEAVIHTHSKYCCIFAAANEDMPVENKEMQNEFGTSIKCGEYAMHGSKKLIENTVAALGNSAGCIMANHGMVACGKNIETAFDNCNKMEKCGERYIERRIKGIY